jgi:hypothetical protein
MTDILRALKIAAEDMEHMEAPGEWVLPVTQAHSVIVRQREEIARLRAGGCARDQSTTQYCVEAAHKAAYIAKADRKIQRWRMALMNIAQGKGDPVAIACKALEADNE